MTAPNGGIIGGNNGGRGENHARWIDEKLDHGSLFLRDPMGDQYEMARKAGAAGGSLCAAEGAVA